MFHETTFPWNKQAPSLSTGELWPAPVTFSKKDTGVGSSPGLLVPQEVGVPKARAKKIQERNLEEDKVDEREREEDDNVEK